MPDYRWVCNACESVNEASEDTCQSCGIASSASPDEIKKHQNPREYYREKAYETYFRDLSFFFFFPCFLIVFIVNGKVVHFLLLAASAIFLLFRSSRLIKHIWGDEWARATLICCTVLYASLIIIRILFVEDGSKIIPWLVSAVLSLPVLAYFYFFKSQRGQRVFEEYHGER